MATASGNGSVSITPLASAPARETPGSDTLVGGSGNDQISGGKGDDFILGGSGNDNLSGDEGNDTLIGGLGSDVLHGGLGSDIFLHSAGDGQDTITDFQNGDRLVLAGYTLDLHDLNFSTSIRTMTACSARATSRVIHPGRRPGSQPGGLWSGVLLPTPSRSRA